MAARTYVHDALTLVGHAEKVDAKLADVLLERDDLQPRIGPARLLPVSACGRRNNPGRKSPHSLMKVAESLKFFRLEVGL